MRLKAMKIVLIAAIVTLLGAGVALAGSTPTKQAGNHGRTPNPTCTSTCTPGATCTPNPTCTGTPGGKHDRKRDRQNTTAPGKKQRGKQTATPAPAQ